MKIKNLKIIGIILLFISLLPVDYSYYQILRWYISILSGYLAYTYYENKKENWVWYFGIITIAFNPISTIQFGREIWILLDLVVIFFLTYSLIKEK